MDINKIPNIRRILDQSIEGVWILDQNSKTIYVNEKLSEFLEYDTSEMMGKSLFFFMKKERITLARKYLKRRKAGIKEEHFFTFLSKSKREIILSIKTSPLFDDDKKYLGTVAFTNIVKIEPFRQQPENQTSRMFSTLVSNLPGVAYRCRNNINWTMEYIGSTSSCFKLTGYKPIDLLLDNKKSYGELILEEDKKYVWECIQKSVKKKKSFRLEYRIITASNEVKYVEEQGRSVVINEKIFLEGYIFDITKQKKYEENLIKSKRKYKEAYNQIEFFKDIFTHDITNVLQGMFAGVQLLENFHSNILSQNSDILEILEVMGEEIKQATRLVSKIKTISILSDQEMPELEKIDALKCLKREINRIKKRFKKKPIDISFKNELDSAYVRANHLIKKIFENILSNAIIHNDSNMVKIKIRISELSFDDNCYIRFSFSDNGRGIKNLEYFKTFERVNRNNKLSYGRGVGLFLVKKILNSYGGEIKVENKKKDDYMKGSNFILFIPKYGEKNSYEHTNCR